MINIKTIFLKNYVTESGIQFKSLPLSYQIFGKELGTAPVVLVNHALTGNSNVTGKNGWWSQLIGDKKTIDTEVFTVLAFNIPGNGFDGFKITDYKKFRASDVAKIFLEGLASLNVDKLFAIIGGSLGGGIAWEMAVLKPNITEHLIPVASDWKATDWLIANCKIQEQFLENSNNPVHDARMHAMLLYRTPKSFNNRFKRTVNQNFKIFNIESWLLHHGKKLQERFQLSAYKLMNQLLKTIDVTKGKNNIEILARIDAKITIVAVDSDLFFTNDENLATFEYLKSIGKKVDYQEIKSIHGHDAFLIEFNQLEKAVSKIFNYSSLEV